MLSADRRVAVTGLGVIAPSGTSVADVWRSALAGHRPFRELDQFPTEGLANRVVSMDVVTAAGERFTVDRDHHPELFWALRGAGGGHFVTVVSFTFQLDPLPAELPTMAAIFPIDDLERLLEVYLPYFEGDEPDAVHVQLGLRTLPGLPPVGVLAGIYNGTDQRAADHEFERLLAGVTPTTSDNRREAHFNFKRRFDGNGVGIGSRPRLPIGTSRTSSALSRCGSGRRRPPRTSVGYTASSQISLRSPPRASTSTRSTPTCLIGSRPTGAGTTNGCAR